MDKILEHKFYRNEILEFYRAAEFCFKFKAQNFIAAPRCNSKYKISAWNLAAKV